MRTVTQRKSKAIISRDKATKRKEERFTISPTREWKLLYSPLTNGSQSRPGVEEKDLCANCRNRDTCTYPKPEGGVWHCKDYTWGEK